MIRRSLLAGTCLGAALIAACSSNQPMGPANSAGAGAVAAGGSAGASAQAGSSVGGAATAGAPAGGAPAAAGSGNVLAGSGGVAGSGSGGAPAAGGSASGGRAGAGNAGTAPGGGGSGSLCPSTALFCEDFETGTLAANGWTVKQSGGTVAITSMMPSHGKNSLQVDIPANAYGASIERKGAPLFPLPNKRMWGRAMVYFDSLPSFHTDIIRGAPAGGGTPQYNVAEQTGAYLMNYYNGSASDCWARPKQEPKKVALKTWMCWEFSFDGAANQFQFYLDDKLAVQVDGKGDGCLSNPTQTWLAPTFGSLQFGAYIAGKDPVQRLWIDDIAVSTQGRMGCPTPTP